MKFSIIGAEEATVNRLIERPKLYTAAASIFEVLFRVSQWLSTGRQTPKPGPLLRARLGLFMFGCSKFIFS